MCALEPYEIHCLSAAVGWQELGNPTEALAELDKIGPAGQAHPKVLEVRWVLCADRKDWPAALATAEILMRAAPEEATGWMHYAYAMRRVPDGSVRKAWDFLLPAFEKFPNEVTIPYNLSCYACQMQWLDEARLWLKRATKIGGKKIVKHMGLQDPDLEPLHAEIKKL